MPGSARLVLQDAADSPNRLLDCKGKLSLSNPMTSLENATEADEVASADPRPVFLAMFEAVRAYLLSEGSTEEARARVALNPKGEATRRFDATAERIALDIARDGLGSFNAFSEEAGYITVGDGDAALDPRAGPLRRQQQLQARHPLGGLRRRRAARRRAARP